MHITKSLFVDFMNYQKLARRKVNKPEVYKHIRKIETIEQEDHIMAIGQAVEDKVKELLQIRYKSIALDLMPTFRKSEICEDEDEEEKQFLENNNFDLQKTLSETILAIKNQTAILYQPTFVFGECLVRADFMVRNGKGYDLIEAKAKSNIHDNMIDDGIDKPIGKIYKGLINDVSFQKYVIDNALKSANLPTLQNIYIAYLNKQYIKKGSLEISKLITIEQVGLDREIQITQRNKLITKVISDALVSEETITREISRLNIYIQLSETQANNDFLRAGSKHLEYFGLSKQDVFGSAMGSGIIGNADYIQNLFYSNRIDIVGLTQDEINGFNDNGQKFIQKYLDCKKSGLPIIQKHKIKEIFDDFRYPICFYDYETVNTPIPIMDDTWPYMHTVVQYSLHKYYADGSMKHYGGVLTGLGEHTITNIYIPDNPNYAQEEYNKVITGSYKDLLSQMLIDIGKDINHSTFVVWSKSFENARNKDIANIYPNLSKAFLNINDNTFDLKDIVAKELYFDIGCKGSASIKKVLPVLVPEMSYDNLEIGRGDIAAFELYNLIINKIPNEKISQTINNLLIYCGQDTLAMVRIYEALDKLSK